MTVRFDGRIALVTGAGNGLGRSHALGLAGRGATVIVNDLGGGRDGQGGSPIAAQAVVDEIVAAGGKAMASGADITDQAAVSDMISSIKDAYGQLDIIVNNAGILRDKTFSKMTMDDFDAVLNVHLKGSAIVTHAAWPLLREQGYGRIVFTTSPSGLYGNFGQANYSAAKMALVGLMNTLHLEGAKYDIRVNCLAPTALTRMTEDLGMPEAAAKELDPESVTPGLLYLVSEQAPSRQILSAAAGCFTVTHIAETAGIWLAPENRTPENVAAQVEAVTDRSDERIYTGANEQTGYFITRAFANK
ncbi:MAG: SDR family NAD(P)-dependent oxidoreductase [Pseudomonadota bacterium]